MAIEVAVDLPAVDPGQESSQTVLLRPVQGQQDLLSALLTGIYGREIHINLQVDPDVVGGLRIQVGDDLYDATVLARLSRAREQLVACTARRPGVPSTELADPETRRPRGREEQR